MRLVAPYTVKTETGYGGLDYELIQAALAKKGHTLKVTILPFARLVATFNENKELEAAAPVLPSFNIPGTLSEPFITYTNVGLSLEKTKLSVSTMADLSNVRVIAFQNARSALGPDFAAAVEKGGKYREEALQQLQLKALFNDRADLVVGERRILKYFIQDPETGVDSTLKTVEHPLFNPVHYSVVFRDPALAADFNAGLAALKASGEYDAIVKKY
ncbi:substrate-binding periplasmic protein [Lacibacterium aquatile]|uniref:Substrate-binding periplasmic protein n=1 Tax=Lacibacterium aquatile TaxID=1168082 RepID=A0ABW5DWN2_9PROT